ncbi:hypothetical protein CO674_19870 [Rhizobium hidalgonense]|uniref:Uncharacterized protein n=1 Tax=Rhizobium hidalgonense TaxID=1538159 RepID=A0ABX4JQQ8_9HYPH|nr:hypothetical protein CO674_19870 [Rhizobium hidalgonense]PON08465.1 hypothetical protein ATY29_05570 [Rhizobium hidalgonense]
MPYGLAILTLGAGVALVTFLSLAQPNVGYVRTQWTALLSMALAFPAIVLYAADAGPPNAWWRAFWTTGMLAYLLHFWWAIFVSFHGSLDAVITRQGFVAYSNFATTGLWIMDVATAWLYPATTRGRVQRVLGVLTWLLVFISFIVASTVFRTGTVRYLGLLLALAVLIALALRIFSGAKPGTVHETQL